MPAKPRIKRGYIKATGPSRRTKYPFAALKEPGEYLADPFPWEDLQRVRYALQKFNKSREAGKKLHMSRYPDGSDEHNFPHVLVGWPG